MSTTARPGTLTVPAGLEGPAGTANGGIAAGLIAQWIEGPAEVRLHQPPPMSTPMDLASFDGGVAASIDDRPVLTARPSSVDLEVPDVSPAPPERPPQLSDHPAPTCIVCGPDHPTPLSVTPVPIDATGRHAAAWSAPGWTADDDGNVRPELVWGVLDCPGGFALVGSSDGDAEAFFPALGTIAADLRLPVRVGELLTVVAWPLGREGRKLHAGTAIIGSDGQLCAVARQTCIAMPLDWAEGSSRRRA